MELEPQSIDNDELLRGLVKILIKWDDKSLLTENHSDTNFFPTCVELLGLPEHLFHEITKSSCNRVEDGTGTRPYGGAMVFLEFCRAYPGIFLDRNCRIVELGAGVGLCGLVLAMARRQRSTSTSLAIVNEDSQCQYGSKSVNESKRPEILLTDGETLAVEIATQNVSFLGLNGEQVDVQILRWTEDLEEIQKVAPLHSFHHVVGTDLLYYRSPTRALITTAEALLAKQDGNRCASDNCTSFPYEGAIFLPGIIRTPCLGDELIDICSDLNLMAQIIPIEAFYDPVMNPMMYNISFLVLTRKGANIQPSLRDVLVDTAHLFSSNEENASDDAILPFAD